MDNKEYEKIENKVLKVSRKLSFVSSFGRMLEEIYINGENIRPGDIHCLIIVLNIYINMAKARINKLEMYLMHMKNSV